MDELNTPEPEDTQSQVEQDEFEEMLDQEIHDMHIPYHFHKFLHDVHGTDDLSDVCEDCFEITLAAVQKHIRDLMDADDSDEESDIANN